MTDQQNDMMPPERGANDGRAELLAELMGTNGAVDSFDADAAAGMEAFGAEKARPLVAELNRGLMKQVKKKRHPKRVLPNGSFVYITVVTVLLLVIIAYVIVRRMQGG